METKKRNKIIYWVITGLFAAVLGSSGVNFLLRLQPVVDTMTLLGFPLYTLTILGIAKVAGVIALLTNKCPKVKEWAYAGFTFLLLGAFGSHLYVGDGLAFVPVVLLVMLIGSYYLWKKTYR